MPKVPKEAAEVDMKRLIVVEVVDDAMADVLRGMTGAQRLRVGFGLFSSARRMLLCHLRHEHPDWSEQQVNREAARRLSHGAV